MLPFALPPFTLWTDSAGLVDGWHRGKVRCTSSSRPAADLWREIWRRLDDMGPEGIKVMKVKGHATDADVERGVSTPWQMACNDHADHFAKWGVTIAEAQCPSQAQRDSFKEAKRWYAWLAELVGHWPADVQPRGEPSEPRSTSMPRVGSGSNSAEAAGRDISRLPLYVGLLHRLAEVEGSLHCEKCGKGVPMSGSWQKATDFAKSKCLGTAKQRMEDAGGPDALGHIVYQNGAVVWCRLCGQWGTTRPKKLLKACARTCHQQSQLNRLKRGHHPLSGERLGEHRRV